MNPLRSAAAVVVSAFPLLAAANPAPAWPPAGLLPPAAAAGPALTPGAFLTPEQGQAVLDAALAQFPDRAAWDAYAPHARSRIQSALGLAPWPRRTPLNAVRHSRRQHDGYTVENVFFESLPGHFVTGNLYRPLRSAAAAPAILSTHGHARPVRTAADYDTHARFSATMQLRCASLARMGAIVLAIDMFGYGDSMQLVGQEAHKQPLALTLQTWNALRAVDFIAALDGVDPQRIGVSGESGGGTQTFLLAALEPRIALSAPVVMVSSYFFGGCPCESGLPIHRGPDHFVNNAMIAALAAPRPQLLVSDGKDWTAHTPRSEFPFLQKIYGYHGAAAQVANVHLADEGHDYGPSKRAALYRFVAEKFGLDLAAVQTADGRIDESRATVEPAAALRAFTPEYPIPHYALHDGPALARALRGLQE